MIVEYIPSVAMENAKLTEEKRNSLYRQMGELLAKLHQVQGESFGFVSRIREGKGFKTWSEALIFEVEDILERLEAAGGISGTEARHIRKIFYENRELLDEIKAPHLLHTDLWAGNILLNKETLEIVAVIDGDRAVFGDIDFEFASSWMDNPFLKEGYGSDMQKPVSADRAKRRQIYQMFFCLLEAYVWYAEYNDRQIYQEHKEQLFEKCVVFQ